MLYRELERASIQYPSVLPDIVNCFATQKTVLAPLPLEDRVSCSTQLAQVLHGSSSSSARGIQDLLVSLLRFGAVNDL